MTVLLHSTGHDHTVYILTNVCTLSCGAMQVEMVYSLLSMLGTHDRDDMSKTLLAMSRSPDSCLAMRQSGCLPLLVQLLHSTDGSPMPDAGAKAARHRAMAALHSVIFAQPDDQRARREMRMLQMLEIVRLYCETLRDRLSRKAITDGDGNNNVGTSIELLSALNHFMNYFNLQTYLMETYYSIFCRLYVLLCV